VLVDTVASNAPSECLGGAEITHIAGSVLFETGVSDQCYSRAAMGGGLLRPRLRDLLGANRADDGQAARVRHFQRDSGPESGVFL
jgi:hypothetical protein